MVVQPAVKENLSPETGGGCQANKVCPKAGYIKKESFQDYMMFAPLLNCAYTRLKEEYEQRRGALAYLPFDAN